MKNGMCKWDKKAEQLVEWTRSKGLEKVVMRNIRVWEAENFLNYLRHEWITRKAESDGCPQCAHNHLRKTEGESKYVIHKNPCDVHGESYSMELSENGWVTVRRFCGNYTYDVFVGSECRESIT